MIPKPSGEQVQVLCLLARGLDHPQIEHDHGIPARTSRLLLRGAMQTLGAANPTHAVTLAIAAGILPPDIATRPHQET